ncbi:MAG: HAD-IB family hydrolase [Novosphingobium sp.]
MAKPAGSTAAAADTASAAKPAPAAKTAARPPAAASKPKTAAKPRAKRDASDKPSPAPAPAAAKTSGAARGVSAMGERLMARMRKEKIVTHADIIREIGKGPKGPRVIAAFDFDGTLLGGFSGVMLMQERMRRKEVNRAEIADNLSSTVKAITRRMEGHEVITRGFTHWAGKSEAEMEELAAHLFETKIQDKVFPEMRAILDAHRKAGHTIVVATAATRFQVEGVVKALGVDNLLCTQVEVVDGKLTGKLVGDSLFGPGKVEALKRFIATHGCDFEDTHFYADGDEEIGLMETVGHPHPVNPSRKLAQAAKANRWAVLRLESRGGDKAGNYVRGIAGLMSILPIAPAGLAVGVLTRDKRQASNIILPTWVQAQLDLAGIKLRVSGRRNLHARRPAVFIFNHRNNHDGMFVALLIRTDIMGVGKKEIGQNPIGKLGTTIVPTILIDRGAGDPRAAAEALKPAIDAVKKGYSIMLAPEGTRVRGHHNSVGPFKKGAFHMAMGAGIPLIPVVIRNALDVGSRDGPMRAGTVDIAVLPPIPVDDWTKENMAEKIEGVRQRFIDTLNDWPEPDEEE